MPRPFLSTRSRVVAAAPESVMAVVRNAETWSRWQPEIRSASGPAVLEEGDAVIGDAVMLGFGVHGHSTVTSISEESFEEDVIVGVRMRITFSFETTSDGTVVSHRLVAQLPTGLMGRLLSVFLRRRLVHMQRTALDRLAAQAERSPS